MYKQINIFYDTNTSLKTKAHNLHLNIECLLVLPVNPLSNNPQTKYPPLFFIQASTIERFSY